MVERAAQGYTERRFEFSHANGKAAVVLKYPCNLRLDSRPDRHELQALLAENNIKGGIFERHRSGIATLPLNILHAMLIGEAPRNVQHSFVYVDTRYVG